MPVCARCGQENPEGGRFCNTCAAPLAVPTSRQERKIVTVLFCDLVGFTQRAEDLDPEDVRSLLQPYHARLRHELERFGGTVEKFIGDAAMALFGAPVAHEDDPERAVRAALSIRNWIREEGRLEVRIAITTGEALVDVDARPASGEGMAAGDVINTAARLQTAAPVNGVLVGESTYRATRQAIDYHPAKPVEAKGKAQPVAVWEAVDVLRGAEGVRADRTGFVGRERELDLLRDLLSRVVAERAPQLITLIGVPGIGKSRLVHELAVAAADGDPMTWHQGRSLPYGEGVAFWALGEMVKMHAGILESDSPAETSAKVGRAVRGVVPDDVEWVEHHLRPLVGLAADGASSGREQSFAAWRRYLEALAERTPTVLVFEDLHWADDALLDFIDELVDWATDVPMLIVGTARPELLDRRPGWGGGKHNAVTISLAPLSDEETARLVHGLLEQAALPAELQQALLRNAGGNALYAEEFVRLLGEGRELKDLPETVQGIIAARLDALSADEKAVVQNASVVGEVFWLGAVCALGGSTSDTEGLALRSLARKEFIRRSRRSSVERETEYAFGHVLVRDVAYGQIPRAARAAKHRAAAQWIESLGRLDDHAEFLAHHYLAALDLAPTEDRAILEGAADALERAGDRSLALGAFAAAARFYGKALEHCAPNSPGRAHLLLQGGRALMRAESSGLELLNEALEAFRSADDPEGAAEAASEIAGLLWNRGDRDGTDAYIADAVALVADRPASAAKAYALVRQSGFHMLGGHFDDAIRVAREGLGMAEELGLAAMHSRALNIIGSTRVDSGDAGGLADLERALEIGHAANAFDVLDSVYENIRAELFILGRVGAASEQLRRQVDFIERYGTAPHRRWTRAVRAGEAYMRGRWDEALEIADAFIADAEAGSPHYHETGCRCLRASIRFARGQSAAALADIERAVELARGADLQAEAQALCAAGLILIAEGRSDQAREFASDLASMGALLLPALNNPWPTLADAAWLLRDVGLETELGLLLDLTPHESQWVAVARAIREGDAARAAEILGEMGHAANEGYARLRAAEAFAAEGRRVEADGQLDSALAFYRSVGAARVIHQAERLLTASA
jgi:class 3 adenylate cyclase/tetratricopeptide (TPR) repeat protein